MSVSSEATIQRSICQAAGQGDWHLLHLQARLNDLAARQSLFFH